MIICGVDVPKLIDHLQGINAKATEYAELPAKAAQARKDLAATTKQLDRANAELEAAESKLAKFQAANKKQYDKEIADKRAALEQASVDLEAANHKLRDVDTAIRDRRVLQDGLAHSVAALLSRLEGKDELPATLIARLAGGG